MRQLGFFTVNTVKLQIFSIRTRCIISNSKRQTWPWLTERITWHNQLIHTTRYAYLLYALRPTPNRKQLSSKVGIETYWDTIEQHSWAGNTPFQNGKHLSGPIYIIVICIRKPELTSLYYSLFKEVIILSYLIYIYIICTRLYTISKEY